MDTASFPDLRSESLILLPPSLAIFPVCNPVDITNEQPLQQTFNRATEAAYLTSLCRDTALLHGSPSPQQCQCVPSSGVPQTPTITITQEHSAEAGKPHPWDYSIELARV